MVRGRLEEARRRAGSAPQSSGTAKAYSMKYEYTPKLKCSYTAPMRQQTMARIR
jgi:hypothetical protein